MRAEGPFAIIGLGLIGGSLAKALTKRGLGEVIGVDPDAATREQATHDRAAHEMLATPGPALARARTVILCMPVGALDAVLHAVASHLAPEALLTDVVGIKQLVAERVRAVIPSARFVGGHPMAGGERGGYVHSHAELFVDKAVAVCGADPEPVAELWRAVGAEPVLMSADQHDRVVAATSHLPYLSALALVSVAERQAGAHLSGRGFFDATRRADFAPEVMAAVVAGNPHAPEALRAQAAELLRMAEVIEQRPGELEALAESAREARRRLDRRS